MSILRYLLAKQSLYLEVGLCVIKLRIDPPTRVNTYMHSGINDYADYLPRCSKNQITIPKYMYDALENHADTELMLHLIVTLINDQQNNLNK
jgi:hypothetical protein